MLTHAGPTPLYHGVLPVIVEVMLPHCAIDLGGPSKASVACAGGADGGWRWLHRLCCLAWDDCTRALAQ